MMLGGKPETGLISSIKNRHCQQPFVTRAEAPTHLATPLTTTTLICAASFRIKAAAKL